MEDRLRFCPIASGRVSLPKLFIGSSREGSDVATSCRACSKNAGSVKPLWNQGVFAPGAHSINALIDVAWKHDSAILVAPPDDTTTSREITSPAVRDNVILELCPLTVSV